MNTAFSNFIKFKYKQKRQKKNVKSSLFFEKLSNFKHVRDHLSDICQFAGLANGNNKSSGIENIIFF